MFKRGVVALVEAAREVAGVDVAALDDGALMDDAVELAQAISVLESALAARLVELDALGVTDRDEGLSTGRWLAREANLPVGRARRSAKVGRGMRALPGIGGATIDGRLSFEHAAVLARLCTSRVVEALVVVQDQVIAWAQVMGFEQWRRHVASLVELLDQDGGHDPRRDVPRSELSLSPTLDGLVGVSGRLAGGDAVLVRDAIEAAADRLYRQAMRDHEASGGELEVPDRAVLRAQALVELCRRAQAVAVGSSRAPRPDVTLIVSADGSEAVTDLAGVRLDDATSRAMVCDADLHALIVDSLGVPLDLGRRVRWASEGQRRALAVRDGGCVFPGCDAPPRWCDAHHVHDWDHGGLSDLDNLALLCRHHHGVSHRRGWTMTAQGRGRFRWTTPTGRVIDSQHQRHSGRRPPDQQAAA